MILYELGFHNITNVDFSSVLIFFFQSPWNYSENAITDIDAVLSGIFRVLSQNGTYFSISFTQPHFRVPLIMRFIVVIDVESEKPDWNNLQRYFKS
uniref:Methyltransferase type 11 domain-containing protein n=1 Tax=Parascaris equorum TaxID=6256 RepID=A0A914R503_PAREQ